MPAGNQISAFAAPTHYQCANHNYYLKSLGRNPDQLPCGGISIHIKKGLYHHQVQMDSHLQTVAVQSGLGMANSKSGCQKTDCSRLRIGHTKATKSHIVSRVPRLLVTIVVRHWPLTICPWGMQWYKKIVTNTTQLTHWILSSKQFLRLLLLNSHEKRDSSI